ncbi:MAG: GNAT family N-acetyltransferase [Alphaproteobacteria bacterium]|nr:GNAT family N-acetyltransferase [Alphaproteobacteria bacterium]
MGIKVRDFEVRLARTNEEKRQVRRLRYEVFVVEEGFKATEEQNHLREEYDRFDTHADYMAVFHQGNVVGAYRIIDRKAAEKMHGFYSEDEYNIRKIKKVRGNIVEVSRACIKREYRNNPLAMSMLWLGMGDYVCKRKVVLLFGLCSWIGLNPAASAHAISYLYYNNLAPRALRTTVMKRVMKSKGLDPKSARMNILPKEAIDKQIARTQMTPLLKGYLNLGAMFGNGVSTDIDQNSYVVLVILPATRVRAAYQKRFGGRENAFQHLEFDMGGRRKFGRMLFAPILRAIGKTRMMVPIA